MSISLDFNFSEIFFEFEKFAGVSMLSIIMTWSLNDTVFKGLLFFWVLLLKLEFVCSKFSSLSFDVFLLQSFCVIAPVH